MKTNKLYVFIFFLFLSSTYTCAQTPGAKIFGIVWDIHHQLVSAATVKLLTIPDSIEVGTTLSDARGRFSFENLKNNTYQVCVTATGYKKFSGKAIIISPHESGNLSPIVLLPDTATLKEVAITAKKSYIEEKIDRTVVNINALISNTGTNALEVLEKAPGVQVDADGNITFQGKSGVLIMIDNKPTYLTSTNLAIYLRSLPSSSLDQIELMDHPPAKYDAAGNAGVINIKTKKNTIKGFNSVLSSSFSQGFYARTTESVNLNYRVNKINLFANASHNYNRNFRTLEIDRRYFDVDGNATAAFNNITYFRPAINNTNLKLGIDYYLSTKTTWGIAFNNGLSYSHDRSPVYSFLYDKNTILDSTIATFGASKNKFTSKGLNLNYTHQFDNMGAELTFDLDGIKNVFERDQTLLNNTYGVNGNLINSQTLTNNLPTAIHIYSAKADYTKPLKNNAKFEVGVKSSYVHTDNAANYFNLNNNVSTVDYNLTNDFLFKENINAAYANFNKSFKRFELQTGVRLENTICNGHQSGNIQKPDSSFINHYTDIFPTAYFSYKLDTAGHNLLVLAYGRRIGRPIYAALNPFTTILDRFTYSSGNPFLKPQFTNNYKLAYSHKNMFTVALTYNYTTDGQNETIRQNGDIFISTTMNIGARKNLDLSFNTNVKPIKWWSMNLYTEVFNNTYKGPLYATYLNQSANSFSVNTNNQFILGKGWLTEVGGFYTTKQVIGQFIAVPSGVVNIGLQKKVMQNRGTIRLNVRDIFHTTAADGTITNIVNTTASYSNFVDSRVVTFGFTYNFGKSDNTSKKRVTGSAESELNRARN